MANEIIDKSIESGINFIDTANVYSEALSEEITGKALKILNLNRDVIIVATKVGVGGQPIRIEKRVHYVVGRRKPSQVKYRLYRFVPDSRF